MYCAVTRNGFFSNEPCLPAEIRKCAEETDIVFILESSQMVGRENFQKQIKFTKLIVNTFRLGLSSFNVGVAMYSSRANVGVRFYDGKEINSFTRAIDKLQYNYNGNSRCLDQGLVVASSDIFSIARAGAFKTVVFLTSGPTCRNWYSFPLSRVVQPLRERFIQVIGVSVGERVTNRDLQETTTNPADIFHADSFDDLGEIVSSLSAHVCKGN